MSQDTHAPCELTILMPCLNEAETLEICIQKALAFLAREHISGEVLIADNGSTDGSQAIASRLGARVVPVARRGYGAALLGGIAAAQGRYTIMGDADDSYNFSALMPFVEQLRQGAELVMENRFLGGIAAGAMPPLHKYIGNPVLSFLGRIFYSIPVGDFHCGLRGFNTEAIRSLGLNTEGMEFASEMVVKASLHKLRITEVPTTLDKDGRSRPPHLRTFRDGWRHLCFLLALTPRWLFIYPGIALFLLGLCCGCLLLFSPVQLGGITLANKSFSFCCLSLLIGVQALITGIITRSYTDKQNLLPAPQCCQSLLSSLSRDRIALMAAIFFGVGLLTMVICITAWLFSGLGNLESYFLDNLAVLSCTAFAIAFQSFHAAFIHEIINNRQ